MSSRSNRPARWRWANVQPCGTDAGYERHIYHSEVACRPCLDAHAARKRAARDRARQGDTQ